MQFLFFSIAYAAACALILFWVAMYVVEELRRHHTK